MSVAVFNAGSSSLKFALYDQDANRPLATGSIDCERPKLSIASYREAVGRAVEAMLPIARDIAVVGQRVVHGGTKYSRTVRIDAEVKAEIARLTELAPLHNPPALETIEAVESALPGIPQVAVFDTAYYSTLAPAQYVYPVPYEWYSELGIRRFGFHGINHSYCATRAAELLDRRDGLRVVSCHLGNGCSATASRGGVAVATTMGFTPLDGLMMGTRPGSLDPGILLYVLRRRGLKAEALEQLLNHESGLKGISGISSDYRDVEAAAARGSDRARLALEIYATRVRAEIGSLATTLGGVDALVFTAGVGEHSAALRAAACDGLQCLGLRIDPSRNVACDPDVDIAPDDSLARILVIRAQEELCIARQALRLRE